MHSPYIKEVSGAETAVLFIHGFLGSPRHFDEYVTLVPENIAVRSILLEGHGAGVKEFSRASMKAWKQQIENEISDLKTKYSSLIIVGHSMGTFFAMEAAVNHKDFVKSLFLIASPLKIGVKPTAALNSVKSLLGLVSQEDAVGRAYAAAHSVKLSMKVWQYIGWIPRYLELFAESKRAGSLVHSVEIPCVFYQSKKDELVSMRSVKCIPDKQNIKTVILNNSMHFIYSDEDMELLKKSFAQSLK